MDKDILFFLIGVIVTLTGNIGFIIIDTAFDIAGEPVRHGVAFDVIIHFITSFL